ncbi:MAG: hypothetical protein JWM33_3454, partial [Caulobacteraceae bacterium]|nr:hypothetical protein [Caulobacteraceae bacterium]
MGVARAAAPPAAGRRVRMSSQADPPPAKPVVAADALRRLARAWTVLAVSLALLAIAYDWRPIGTPEHLFLWRQDLPVLLAATLALWLLALRPVGLPSPFLTALAGRRAAFAVALLVLAAGWFGAWAVFEHYNLSLDEFLAEFDAAIYRRG